MSASAPRRAAETIGTVLMAIIGSLVAPAMLAAATTAPTVGAAAVDVVAGLGLAAFDLWLIARARTTRASRRPHAESAFDVAACTVMAGVLADDLVSGRIVPGTALVAGLAVLFGLLARRSLRHVVAGTSPAPTETAVDRSRREWRGAMAALKELRRR